MAETKIIYHIDEEETPYLVKLTVSPEKVTLADFKNVLNNRPVNSYKFFFKSMDQDFGVVKEEISDDNAKLPCFNGRVVSWLVLAEGTHSDGGSQCTESHKELLPPLERTGGIGDSRPPSFHANAVSSRDGLDTETGTESLQSQRRERERERAHRRAREIPRVNGHSKSERVNRDSAVGYDSASVMSSELESSSFIDSEEDEDASRSDITQCFISQEKLNSSSFSSITDSTMSLNIITVTLNMGKNLFTRSLLSFSHHPSLCLLPLRVNDVNFENMSNDDAVRILRELVSKPGPISLTVAKCWDPSPRSYFTIPRAEPVRPIDPAAWISHTTALSGPYPHYGMIKVKSSVNRMADLSCSTLLFLPHFTEFDDLPLSVSKTDMATIVKVMQLPDSGLEIRDRMWLKITIANAVIGADVVDWLFSRVEGFKDRRDARKYASSLLKHGYLRHTVNKITFSEQCYYTFGDLCQNMASLNLNEGSSGGGSDHDGLAPLPPPGTNPWPLGGQPYPYPGYPTPPPGFPPVYSDPCHSFHSGSAGSQQSEGSRSSGSNPSAGKGRRPSPREKDHKAPCCGGSESEMGTWVGRRGERAPSQLSHQSHSRSAASQAHSSHSNAHSGYSHGHHGSSYGPPGLPPPYCLAHLTPKAAASNSPPGAPPVRELANVPPELTASRQSFQHAMGNPCEFFVDIM
uniref:Dishevelled segment polarity protein 1 n=2 Tax=Sinocyclocheilus rhinocerous TaxID=307959 RepID=A0A673J5F3_9TELE